jgi:glycosyltransferase involved in cell wall biosynthesis
MGVDYGASGKVVDACCANSDGYRIKILHVTADELPRLMNPDDYNVATIFWETDRLPQVFVDGLQDVNEIWTGSQANVDAIRKSGITKPVFVFPQPMTSDIYCVAPYNSSQTDNFDGYLFYSIFEWHARKNPELLLHAYLNEFTQGESVGLLLKTYSQSFTPQRFALIRDRVIDVVAEHGTPSAKVFLELNPLSYSQIQGIHKRGDCYVTAHRGEGWGIPQVEAMANANPSISTGYGGVNEYVTDWMNGLLIPYSMEPVTGMEHATRYYCADQNWASVTETDLRERLRYAWENQDVMTKIGESGRTLVRDRFNYTTVGEMMKNRLETIEQGITT